jgi:DNA-binding transcriptional ArsR family regulator
MVQYRDDALDSVFAALSDPTRRAVLQSLSNGSLSVTELARPHGMSLTGFMKHLHVLENASLVDRSKEGRVVHYRIAADPMQKPAEWLSRYQKFWTRQLDSLARYLDKQEDLTRCQTAPKSDRRSRLSASTKPRQKSSGARGLTRKR